ncbi:MAG TPA: hypothetical protein VGN01_02250 [Acidobacteriaceae bacterium]
MSTLLLLRARSFSCSLVLLSAVGASLGSASLNAQSAAKPAGSSSGFSIETEMLTYRALESNGEAIACDVAAYLYGAKTDFRKMPGGAVCNVGSNSSSSVGVVVLPFDRSAFADFQIWRSDMQTMAEFEVRGANACAAHANAQEGAQPGRPQGRGLTGTTSTTSAASTAAAVGGVMGAMTPAGAMLTTGAGILGLFAKNQDSSPVGGTIEDQAFMDNVSRELRSVNVSVLMPTVYSPFGLSSIDPARSPFVTALDKLLHTRDCLVASKGQSDPDVKNIEEFLNVLAGTTTPAKSTAPTSASSASSGGSSATAAAPAPPSSSHLSAVLNADGLAQRLGADPATGKVPDNAPHHLLLVKALESGGSVNRSASIFGSKMSYSGGSVGTYALFNLDGDLECSGNVYDYAGPVGTKKFQKQLRDYKPDPSNQVIFQRGTCRGR